MFRNALLSCEMRIRAFFHLRGIKPQRQSCTEKPTYLPPAPLPALPPRPPRWPREAGVRSPGPALCKPHLPRGAGLEGHRWYKPAAGWEELGPKAAAGMRLRGGGQGTDLHRPSHARLLAVGQGGHGGLPLPAVSQKWGVHGPSRPGPTVRLLGAQERPRGRGLRATIPPMSGLAGRVEGGTAWPPLSKMARIPMSRKGTPSVATANQRHSPCPGVSWGETSSPQGAGEAVAERDSDDLGRDVQGWGRWGGGQLPWVISILNNPRGAITLPP